jgi:nicotinate-nucleotide pyrophosphorylase
MSIPDAAHALITAALEEDVGPGDWTTLWTVAPETRTRAPHRGQGAMG